MKRILKMNQNPEAGFMERQASEMQGTNASRISVYSRAHQVTSSATRRICAPCFTMTG